MINPNTQEVFELSDYFHQLGNAIGEYIQLHKAKLTDDERNDLFDKQIELLQLSGKINIRGISLVFEDMQDALQQMNDITGKVKKTVERTLAVQDAIDIATSLVGIGTAIISQDPGLFIKSCSIAGSKLNAIKNKRM